LKLVVAWGYFLPKQSIYLLDSARPRSLAANHDKIVLERKERKKDPFPSGLHKFWKLLEKRQAMAAFRGLFQTRIRGWRGLSRKNADPRRGKNCFMRPRNSLKTEVSPLFFFTFSVFRFFVSRILFRFSSNFRFSSFSIFQWSFGNSVRASVSCYTVVSARREKVFRCFLDFRFFRWSGVSRVLRDVGFSFVFEILSLFSCFRFGFRNLPIVFSGFGTDQRYSCWRRRRGRKSKIEVDLRGVSANK